MTCAPTPSLLSRLPIHSVLLLPSFVSISQPFLLSLSFTFSLSLSSLHLLRLSDFHYPGLLLYSGESLPPCPPSGRPSSVSEANSVSLGALTQPCIGTSRDSEKALAVRGVWREGREPGSEGSLAVVTHSQGWEDREPVAGGRP